MGIEEQQVGRTVPGAPRNPTELGSRATASPTYPRVSYLLIAIGCLVIWTAVADEPTKTNAAPDTEIYWSLKPVSRTPVPAVANRKWKPRNPIDTFLYAKLAEMKLAPS